MKKSFSPIQVNLEKGIYRNEISGKMEVELRQEVQTTYPSIKLSNSLSDSLFTEAEASIKTQVFTESRVAWMKVGEINDIDAITTKLAEMQNPTLYKILSLNPILTDSDKGAILAELTTEEKIAEKQKVLNEKGEVVLYNGVPQYRRVFYSNTSKEDVDYREVDFAAIKVKTKAIELVN